MWLSELVGRLQYLLNKEGDMKVRQRIRGFRSSVFEDNFADVESHSFAVTRLIERNEKGQIIKDIKQMEVVLYE